MGINDRVKGFLDSWPVLKERLEEVLREDERLFHRQRACRSLPGEFKDYIPSSLAKGIPAYKVGQQWRIVKKDIIWLKR